MKIIVDNINNNIYFNESKRAFAILGVALAITGSMFIVGIIKGYYQSKDNNYRNGYSGVIISDKQEIIEKKEEVIFKQPTTPEEVNKLKQYFE